MTHFTIDTANNITAHHTAAEAKALEGAERFNNEGALAKLAADWPAARLVEIYNSLTGVTPVTKFKDRKTAATRIWKAIQTLGQPAAADQSQELGAKEQSCNAPEQEQPSAAEQATEAATETPEAVPEEAATTTDVAPQVPATAPEEAPAKKKAIRAKKERVAKEPKGTRAGSKTETVLALMKQPGGTTLKAIMEATQWQAHSVRGFISGTLGKKMGLTVVSAKGENGERNYSINA